MEGLAQDPPQHSYATHEHVNGDANGRPDPKYFRTSPSLTPPEPSEPDSDFGIEEAGAEAVHSRPGSSEDEASDDSTYGAARRFVLHQTDLNAAAVTQSKFPTKYCLDPCQCVTQIQHCRHQTAIRLHSQTIRRSPSCCTTV